MFERKYGVDPDFAAELLIYGTGAQTLDQAKLVLAQDTELAQNVFDEFGCDWQDVVDDLSQG